jgi:hypothetical protein
MKQASRSSASALPQLAREHLAPRFRRLGDEDLSTSGAVLVLRKPGHGQATPP